MYRNFDRNGDLHELIMNSCNDNWSICQMLQWNRIKDYDWEGGRHRISCQQET